MSNPNQGFTGKPGAWYIVLDPDQWYTLTEVFGISEEYLEDFRLANDGCHYALLSDAGDDIPGIVNTGMFVSEEWIPTAYVNTSQMPSLFGGM